MSDKELVRVNTSKLPDPGDLLLGYAWNKEAQLLLRAAKLPSGRALSELAVLCYTHGLKDDEAYSMVEASAIKWGIDAEPSDLLSVIKMAKASAKTLKVDDSETRVMTAGEILDSEFEIEWIVPGLLTESGVLAFCGGPGIGKTQAMTRLAIAIITGGKFLGYTPQGPLRRVLFFSLEMIQIEIKDFLRKMESDLNDDERKVFRENLIFYPHGSALYLNEDSGRQKFWEVVNQYQPDGIIIDSWSRAVGGNLSDDTVVREAMAFIDLIRKVKGCWVGIIHHTKKAQGDSKPNTLDDIFGSRFFTAGLSNAVVVWPHRGSMKTVEFHIVKSRFSPVPEKPIVADRTKSLNFKPKTDAHVDKTLDELLESDGIVDVPELTKKEKRQEIESQALGVLLGSHFTQFATKGEVDMSDGFDPAMLETDSNPTPGMEDM